MNSNYKFNFSSWIDKINSYKKMYTSYEIQKDMNKINPNQFMNKISEMLHPNSIVCLDIGQNQIWACQSLKLKKNQRLVNAGGMGAMGFALPSAIGAWAARPNYKIVVIAGETKVNYSLITNSVSSANLIALSSLCSKTKKIQ